MRRLAAAVLVSSLSAGGIQAQFINAASLDPDSPRARYVMAVLTPLLAGELDAALAAVDSGRTQSVNGDALKQMVRQLAAQVGTGDYRIERMMDAPVGVVVIVRHTDGSQAGFMVAVEEEPPHRLRAIQQGMVQGGNVQGGEQPRLQVRPPGGEPAGAPATAQPGAAHVHEATLFEVYAASADALQRGRTAMEHVVGEYRRYFGEDPPRLGYVVYEDRDQARAIEAELKARGMATFAWPAETRRGQPGADGQPTLEPTSSNTLAHEAMHGLMRARFGERVLPPWFDEGIASLIEFSDGKTRYWDRLRTGFAQVEPLAVFFSRPHPAAGIQLSGAAAASVLADATAGRPMRITIPEEQAAANLLFYPQGMAFLTFLAEREGPRFVGRVGDALAAGASLEEVLTTGTSFTGGMARLEASWLEWLRERTR